MRDEHLRIDTKMGKIRTVIACGDRGYAHRLEELLVRSEGEAQYEVVAVCYDGICVMEQVVKGELELLLIDLFLPRLDGGAVLTKIKERYKGRPPFYVLVLSDQEEYRYVKYAFRCGVHGFYSKREGTEELLSALRTVLMGKKYLSSGLRLSPPLKEGEQGGSAQKEPLHQCDVLMLLTKREMEVLKLLLEELSTDEIARRLYISKNTAKAHKNRILKKLGMNSVEDLVQYFKDNRVLLNG